VLRQIDVLVNEHGVRNLKIADEMFVLNRKHVLGICDRIIERGYDLNIWAYPRVNTIKDGMLDKLKAAGVNWLAFGIAAGANRVRDNVEKSFDQAEVYQVLRRVRDAEINVIGNYIVGLPEDDRETMQATLDLLSISAASSPISIRPWPILAHRCTRGRCGREFPCPKSGPAIRSTRGTVCRYRRSTCRPMKCCVSAT
jgi:radical SAM superfamily enzyme YgiQ (UPF0313 family)